MFRRSFIVAVLIVPFWGCVSAQPPKRPLDLPFTKVYPASYDLVWTATTRVLDIYSVVRIDRDAGIIETDWTNSKFNRSLYERPGVTEFLEAVRYRIKIKFSKGIVAQSGQAATRVQITKELAEHKNFLLDYKRIPTDQIEEKVLLYRIGQRIKIASAIQRKSTGAQGEMTP